MTGFAPPGPPPAAPLSRRPRSGGLHAVAIGASLAVLAAVAGLALTGPHPRPVAGTVPAVIPAGPAAGQPIDSVRCQVDEQLAYHLHAHLTILIDGAPWPVQPGIGIPLRGARPLCFYWVHTHDRSGLIHLESPTPRLYTLGQLFDIWGQPLDSSHLLSFSGRPVTAYVNGRQAAGDLRATVLSGHRQIVLEFGQQVPPPPYRFPPGF
jgi:hypothetical protein